MIGQTIVATSQLFVLNIPPLLAAVWFSDREVSRATAYGVFGNQVGIALGFFIPSLLVPNFSDDTNSTSTHSHNMTTSIPMTTMVSTLVNISSNDSISIVGVPEVGAGLRNLFFSVAIFTTLLFLIIAIFFNDKPEFPPSAAQAQAVMANQNSSFYSSVKALATNPNFILLFITYGLNTGVFYAVSTVLNQMVTGVFGDNYVKEAGYMGVTITIAGIVGSIVCGYLLDWTRLFKQITVGIYVLSLIGMIAFTIALQIKFIWLLFIVSGILGFFMTGYLPIGFEFAAEISYPQPEGTSAGLLNAAAQVFYSYIL
jgi:FLVCR family feline leukemia virus subgroup C receptor-related protein